MLIVPELKKVFILVPRTGTGTLYREIQRVYPKSMLLYRHMEADGCPAGYDRWERVGFVRHPLARLYSLYIFMRNFGGGAQVQGGAASADAERARKQVDMPFVEWLLTNKEPWTVPYDMNEGSDYWPVLSRRNPAPETRLSQFSYLRPDLGTTVLPFHELRQHMARWGLDPKFHKNKTDTLRPEPDIFSTTVMDHLSKFQAWELAKNLPLI